MLPHVIALVVGGWAWALWDRALMATHTDTLVVVCAAWALLHAGTLWLNAAFDRDEGEVLLGRTVRPPSSIRAWGHGALLVAVALAFVGNPVSGAACLGAALLAVAYSHPRWGWKGHPVGGPLVNVVGYGLLSPLAGWALVEVSATPRTFAVWSLSAVGILGMYFAAQAFQAEEDRARGYRTLVATHGPAVVLGAARACMGIAVVGGTALALAGWIPRVCLFGVVAWWVLDRWLVAWAAQRGGGDVAWAQGFTARLMWTALLGIALAFGEYARESLAGEPVAGLGTIAGHPPDRPVLPPRQIRLWEAAQRDPR